MRVIVIDAVKREVREEQISGPTLAFLQKVCGGYVDIVRLLEGADLWVSDEGLINGTQEFFTIDGFPQPLAGSAVLAGNDGSGETTGTDIDVELVREMVGFCDLKSVRHMIRYSSVFAKEQH